MSKHPFLYFATDSQLDLGLWFDWTIQHSMFFFLIFRFDILLEDEYPPQSQLFFVADFKIFFAIMVVFSSIHLPINSDQLTFTLHNVGIIGIHCVDDNVKSTARFVECT